MAHNLLQSLLLFLLSSAAFSAEPVYIGFNGSYGPKLDTSAKAIELGAQIAVDEINEKGGVLSGRKLILVTKDNQGLSMHGRDNYIGLAEQKNMAAVLGGKHSAVIVESIPDAQRLKVPYMSVWGTSNQITDDVTSDSYMFRVSLKDQWGVTALLTQAVKQSPNRQICVLVPHTSWGLSGERVLREKAPALRANLVSVSWYSTGDKDFVHHVDSCSNNGATIMIMIANDVDGAAIVNEVASRPESTRLPIVAHWGITEGAFSTLTADALTKVDLRVIQTFSFVNNPRPKAQSLARKSMAAQAVKSPDLISSPVGVAQAYDGIYLIASAINKAQSTQGTAVRDALEKLTPYEGVIKKYAPAFTKTKHDALDSQQVLFARIKPDGSITPIR